MPDYWFSSSHEMFPPSDLLAQAVEAAGAGFDGIGCSDHYQPWWPGGESGQAWVWLGAAGHAIADLPLGTAVTPPGPRYHPALIAQAFMTLEEMFPGRAYLGLGSGEALNEVPFGEGWPAIGDQIERMEEALEIITRLWDGETLTFEGKHFRTEDAVLHTRAAGKPMVYVSAFGPQAAAVAGRWGDGVWTLADPENVPAVLEAYRASASDAGQEPGRVILQSGFAYGADDDAALEGARVWKGTVPDEFYTEDWHIPADMQTHVSEHVSDDEFKAGAIVGAGAETTSSASGRSRRWAPTSSACRT